MLTSVTEVVLVFGSAGGRAAGETLADGTARSSQAQSETLLLGCEVYDESLCFLMNAVLYCGLTIC